jgi:hypothetical protein
LNKKNIICKPPKRGLLKMVIFEPPITFNEQIEFGTFAIKLHSTTQR